MNAIDIRSHGAVSGQDISHALQSAIDEAGKVVKNLQKQNKWMNVAGHVIIPAGIWLLERPVIWRSGVCITGENQSSTLLECDIPEGRFALDSTGEPEPYSMKISNLGVRSLARHQGGFVRLTMANRSCIIDQIFCEGFNTAFDMTNCFTAVMKDCTVFDCVNGLIGRNLTNCKFYNNKIENCCHDGFSFAPSDTNTSTGLSLYGNIFQGNGKAGLRLFGVDQVYGSGNFFEGNNRIPFRKDKSIDCHAHIEIDLDVEKRAAGEMYTWRNGNIRFDSTFFTQGYYSPPDTTCVSIKNGELVSFTGGTMRAFNTVSSGFYIGDNVTLAIISQFTFEGIDKSRSLTGPGVTQSEIKNCIYRIGSKGNYHYA